jgi:hypothetical protein
MDTILNKLSSMLNSILKSIINISLVVKHEGNVSYRNSLMLLIFFENITDFFILTRINKKLMHVYVSGLAVGKD